jgi:hypothetical protein
MTSLIGEIGPLEVEIKKVETTNKKPGGRKS